MLTFINLPPHIQRRSTAVPALYCEALPQTEQPGVLFIIIIRDGSNVGAFVHAEGFC